MNFQSARASKRSRAETAADFCSLDEMRNMRKTWQSKRDKWNWRSFLTEDEAKAIRASDEDRASIERLEADYQRRHGLKRQKIVNRAIQRAKYAALTTADQTRDA